MALAVAADVGLKVWSVTADGTTINLKTFQPLGCQLSAAYVSIVTKFKHPDDVFAILDPCHILKLARNALVNISSFIDISNKKVK